jgi:hypothetical protein
MQAKESNAKERQEEEDYGLQARATDGDRGAAAQREVGGGS